MQAIKQEWLITIIMENEAGALARIVGLFAQRGYNIEAMNVAVTEDPTMSRLSVEVLCTKAQHDQIVKQLNRLIEVIKVIELSQIKHVERELLLIRIRTPSPEIREEIRRLSDIFRSQIIDVTDSSYAIQVVGKSSKIRAFIKAVPKGCILEVAHTGKTAIERGVTA